MPEVSVIMPCLNAGRRRALRALRGVLGQTMPDFELIVVDDGSTDGSVDAMRRCSDSRVRFLGGSRHRGIIPARLDGLAHATGEYVLFADADDALRPDALRHLTDAARRKDADVVIMGFRHRLGPAAFQVLPSRSLFLPGAQSCAAALTLAFFAGCGITPSLWDKMVRRSVFGSLMSVPSDTFMGEDTIISLSYAPNVRSIATAEYAGVDWYPAGGSGAWLERRWTDYLNLHTMLCGNAAAFASPGLDPTALRCARAATTLRFMLRRAASLHALSLRPSPAIAREIGRELNRPVWDVIRDLADAHPTLFADEAAARALAARDIAALAAASRVILNRYRHSILYEKFSRYV